MSATLRLHSLFLRLSPSSDPKFSSSLFFSSSHHHNTTARRNQRSFTSYPSIRALDLDQNTLVAISVGVASVAVGIGIPIFYETQIDNAAKRENTQPCFPCNGTGAQPEISRCINCEGAGTLSCTTCQGTGIQPRYLDRREFKDDD